MFFTLPLHISIFQLYLAMFYRARPIIACESCKWHFCYSRLHFTWLCICLSTEEGLTTLAMSRLFRKGMIEVQIFHGILFEDAQITLQKSHLIETMSISINCPAHLNMNAVPVCYPFHYKLLRWWIFPYCFPFKFLVYVVQRTWISTQSTFLVNLCVGEFYLVLFSYFSVRSAICFH